MFQAVVFDMDGTLLDTERLAVDAWEEAAHHLHIDLKRDDVLRTVGRDWADTRAILTEAIGPDADFEALARLTNEIHHEQLEAGAPVKRGARELLERLRAAGIPMALATSTARAGARRRLEKVGLWHYFCDAACGDEVERGKPFPDIFALAARRCELPAERCIAVEDSPAGVRAARGAGMAVVMVPDLVAPDADTRSFADVVANDLFQAADWIFERLELEKEETPCNR